MWRKKGNMLAKNYYVKYFEFCVIIRNFKFIYFYLVFGVLFMALNKFFNYYFFIIFLLYIVIMKYVLIIKLDIKLNILNKFFNLFLFIKK